MKKLLIYFGVLISLNVFGQALTTPKQNLNYSIDVKGDARTKEDLQVRGGAVIGDTTLNGNASLELTATDKGVLLNRLNTTQQNAIVLPANGLTIYNTDSNALCRYDAADGWRMYHYGNIGGITGPTGATGPAGSVGATGATGATGSSAAESAQNGASLVGTAFEWGGNPILHETFVEVPAAINVFFHNEDTSKYFGIGDADLDGRWNVVGLVDQFRMTDTSGSHFYFGWSDVWNESVGELIAHHIVLYAVDAFHMGVANAGDTAVLLLEPAALQYVVNHVPMFGVDSTGDVFLFEKPNTEIDTNRLVNILHTGTNGKVFSADKENLFTNDAVALVDAATMDLTDTKHTLSSSSATRTFTISYTGDDITLVVDLATTSATYTFPAGSLCVSEGTASGDNTLTLSGTSGDDYVIATKKVGNVYYVVSKNFGQ